MAMTRKDYLNNYSPATEAERWTLHRQYYAQFVDERTIREIVSYIGADRILASTCRHLNDIDSREWDNAARNIHLAIRFKDVDDYPTLAGLVCVAKEAARQFIDKQKGMHN